MDSAHSTYRQPPWIMRHVFAYFIKWWSLVARMTTVTSPDAPDAEIAGAAPMHPVFRLEDKG
jgi:hypothetical protein